MNSRSYRVYGLSVDGVSVRYVGLTTQRLEKRLSNHRVQARKGTRTPLYDWMRKQGVQNVRISLIIECECSEDMCEVERGCIAYAREQGGCLNVTEGGEGFGGVSHTSETKARISKTLMKSVTHCPNGHERTEENWRRTPKVGRYICYACKREQEKVRRESR